MWGTSDPCGGRNCKGGAWGPLFTCDLQTHGVCDRLCMAGVHVVHQVDAAKAGDAAQQGSKQPSCCSQWVRLTTVQLRMVVACGAGVQSDAVRGGRPLRKARTLCGNRGTAPCAGGIKLVVDVAHVETPAGGNSCLHQHEVCHAGGRLHLPGRML